MIEEEVNKQIRGDDEKWIRLSGALTEYGGGKEKDGKWEPYYNTVSIQAAKYSKSGRTFERPDGVWLLPSQPEKTLNEKKRMVVSADSRKPWKFTKTHSHRQ